MNTQEALQVVKSCRFRSRKPMADQPILKRAKPKQPKWYECPLQPHYVRKDTVDKKALGPDGFLISQYGPEAGMVIGYHEPDSYCSDRVVLYEFRKTELPKDYFRICEDCGAIGIKGWRKPNAIYNRNMSVRAGRREFHGLQNWMWRELCHRCFFRGALHHLRRRRYADRLFNEWWELFLLAQAFKRIVNKPIDERKEAARHVCRELKQLRNQRKNLTAFRC